MPGYKVDSDSCTGATLADPMGRGQPRGMELEIDSPSSLSIKVIILEAITWGEDMPYLYE